MAGKCDSPSERWPHIVNMGKWTNVSGVCYNVKPGLGLKPNTAPVDGPARYDSMRGNHALLWKTSESRVLAAATELATEESSGCTGTLQTPLVVKGLSASVGAILTAVFTTPLDVIKTRQQLWIGESCPASGVHPSVSCECKFGRGPNLQLACHTSMPSMLETMLTISRREGFRVLWSGLAPSLYMSIPSISIYFSAYDEIRSYISRVTPGSAWDKYAPVYAGAISRVMAVTLVAPMELIKTKMQSEKTNYGVYEGLRREVRARGTSALWRGLQPTLLRDVPFSSLYWLGYEWASAFYQRVLGIESPVTGSSAPTGQSSLGDQFLIAFLSGATSGVVAAALTTPFDVVKTRQQVQLHGNSSLPEGYNMRAILRQIAEAEGLTGLFAGLIPRCAKIAPACAIMISSYELGKRLFLSPDLADIVDVVDEES